ncbi:hypothetical protein [Lentilactobacillus parakefiri]|nr:hypothetical protein [Lentilactobacillus parakefiri]
MIIDKNEIEATLLKAENLGGALFCGIVDLFSFLLELVLARQNYPYT